MSAAAAGLQQYRAVDGMCRLNCMYTAADGQRTRFPLTVHKVMSKKLSKRVFYRNKDVYHHFTRARTNHSGVRII